MCENKNSIEMKRIYRCPYCNGIVFEKLRYNSIYRCPCGVNTHINNLTLEFER